MGVSLFSEDKAALQIGNEVGQFLSILGIAILLDIISQAFCDIEKEGNIIFSEKFGIFFALFNFEGIFPAPRPSSSYWVQFTRFRGGKVLPKQTILLESPFGQNVRIREFLNEIGGMEQDLNDRIDEASISEVF